MHTDKLDYPLAELQARVEECTKRLTTEHLQPYRRHYLEQLRARYQARADELLQEVTTHGN